MSGRKLDISTEDEQHHGLWRFGEIAGSPCEALRAFLSPETARQATIGPFPAFICYETTLPGQRDFGLGFQTAPAQQFGADLMKVISQHSQTHVALVASQPFVWTPIQTVMLQTIDI